MESRRNQGANPGQTDPYSIFVMDLQRLKPPEKILEHPTGVILMGHSTIAMAMFNSNIPKNIRGIAPPTFVTTQGETHFWLAYLYHQMA